MSTKIIAPNRNLQAVNEQGLQELRLAKFFDSLVLLAENLPDQATAVADVTVSTTANNTAAINAILAALRTANLMDT